MPRRDESRAKADERVAARADRARERRRSQGSVAAPTIPLSREHIVGTALALVDRDGLSALSMRKLGAELGVDPMAVYYYVPNKDALLDAIVEAVMGEIDLTLDDPANSPEDRIMCAARAYRDVMLAHRNAIPIVLARGPRTPEAMRPVELLIGILRDAGLPPAKAMAGMNAIAASVRGIVAMIADDEHPPASPDDLASLDAAFPPERFPYLREAVMCRPEYLDEDFEFGLRALARGLVESTGDSA